MMIKLARQLNAAHFMREPLGIRSELRVFALEKMAQPIAERRCGHSRMKLASIAPQRCQVDDANAAVFDFDEFGACEHLQRLVNALPRHAG